MRMPSEDKGRSIWLALPGVCWLAIFFVLPLVFVFIASFMTRASNGAPSLPFTLDHYQRSIEVFAPVIWRSLSIALQTTVICLLFGYPLAFFISSRSRAQSRLVLLFLILLPFWTNFLVRTYALQFILGREGLINGLLQMFGRSSPLQILNTPFAVMLGMVYGFLPFMVLPIYAAISRLDLRFIEAAFDLGANDWQVFWRVVWPLTLPGVIAGCMLVFIPAVGAFITPDLLGGTRGLMIGNLIQRQFGGRGNIPLGSALSMLLMAIVIIGIVIYQRYGSERSHVR